MSDRTLVVLCSGITEVPDKACQAFQLAKSAFERGRRVTVVLMNDGGSLPIEAWTDMVCSHKVCRAVSLLLYLTANDVRMFVSEPYCSASRISIKEAVAKVSTITWEGIIGIAQKSNIYVF